MASARLPAWLKRWARRFLALPLLLASTGGADAQAPQRCIVNKNIINLPILLDNSVRPQLKEVQLYVKETPTSPWTLKERVPPTQTLFSYRAPSEGEYAFNVVTVDRMGRSVPADVNKEAPAMIVVVDTTSPTVNLHLTESTDKGQNVLVEVNDPNYDPSRTRCFYQRGDKFWQPLDCLPGLPEQFCIPTIAVTTGMVRIQAADKAGNVTTREFNVHAMRPAVATAPATSGPGTIVTPAPTSPGAPGVVMVDPMGGKTVLTPPPPRMETPPGLPPAPITIVEVPGPKDRIEVISAKTTEGTLPAMPPTLDPAGARPDKSAPLSVELPAKSEASKVITLPSREPRLETRDVTPPATSRETTPVNLHVSNSTRVYLDYKIEAAGVSGVGRVEVWMTKDSGQSWQKIGEDKKQKSPVEVTLPGEGVFGVSLVVTNGRGFGGVPPQPGDQPDYWIEVDLTRPSGEITAVRPSGADDGSMVISWNARDKKLADEPIDLYFATTREGPWTPIAKGLKNDGAHRWSPPHDVASHAYIRMVVRDMAGNSVTCETTHPIALDDLSRPRGRVLGVSTTPRSGGLDGGVGP